MPSQIIFSQAGPLPITGFQFSALGDMPMCLEINGSVYSTTDNQMIGIAIQLNQTLLGTAQIFSNGANTHRAVVPAYFQVQLVPGTNFLSLSFSTKYTTSDANDFFTAVLDY